MSQAVTEVRGPTREQELAEIVQALDLLLRAAFDADKSLPPPTWERPTFYARPWIARASADNTARNLARNPVGEACRRAIKPLGERLHAMGGTDLMRDVSYQVAEMDAASSGGRLSAMDSRWNGIGSDGPDAWWS